MNNKEKIHVRKVTAIACILIALLALAGCGGFLDTDNSKSTVTSSPTLDNNSTTPTETIAPSPKPTTTKTPERTTKQKYSYFRDAYVESMENKSVNVVNNSIDSDNETLHITYEMRNPDDDVYTGRERENVSLLYVVGVEVYLNKTKTPTTDKTWVPKRVNVTAVTPEGELYETAYTTFERAKKMIDGEISAKRYLLEYYNTIEPGPANPDYEGGS